MTTTTTPTEPGTIVHVPPGTLLLERNIRDAKPSPELVASVRNVGVLEPITAVTAADGGLVVRLGHRRVLAAVEAGAATVPVYIAGVDDTAAAAEIHRIITQHDENTHRTGLTAGEEVGAIAQLAAFGLSPDEIATQARIAQDRVHTALTVKSSKLAAKAAERYEGMTLDQAAVVAEFDDDTETAKSLIVTAVQEPEKFAHAAQRARDERTRTRHRAQLLDQLETAGVKVIDKPDHSDKPKRLSRLHNDKGKEITEAAHRKCPGHVAFLHEEWTWIGPDDQPTDHTTTGARNIIMPKIGYACRDPKKHGHTDAWSGPSSTRTSAADLPDDEREKAKQQRRLIIENNKAWDAAQTVRREWIKIYAKVKTPPKGAAAFIATALSHDRYILTHEGNQTDREQLCTEWGLPMVKHGYGKRVDVPPGTSEGRALVIALVQVLAAHESSIDRNDWRRDGTKQRHGRYLRFLESIGYGLSDVEKYAISTKTA